MEWQIKEIKDLGMGYWYRYQIRGEIDGEVVFAWSVPNIVDARYAPHPFASLDVKAAIALAKGS